MTKKNEQGKQEKCSAKDESTVKIEKVESKKEAKETERAPIHTQETKEKKGKVAEKSQKIEKSKKINENFPCCMLQATGEQQQILLPVSSS